MKKELTHDIITNLKMYTGTMKKSQHYSLENKLSRLTIIGGVSYAQSQYCMNKGTKSLPALNCPTQTLNNNQFNPRTKKHKTCIVKRGCTDKTQLCKRMS